LEIERTLETERRGRFDDAGIATEDMLLLEAGPQVRGRRRRKPAIELVETAAGADCCQRGGERATRLLRVVHVVGGDALDAGAGGDLGERVVANRVERIAVIPQFDRHVVRAEHRDEIGERACSRGRAIAHERERHRALAATGEHEPVPVVHLRELGQRVDRLALLATTQVRRTERARQTGVALRISGQYHEVLTFRVGFAVLRLAQVEAELGTEHRGHPDFASGFGEADHAVEAVVVGEAQRFETEPRGFLDELFGM
jgi:hypothetical protein